MANLPTMHVIDMATPAAHSPFGGSSAYRYMECSGSVNMGQGIKDEESEYAMIGTAAHDLAATCLVEHADAWEFVGGFADVDSGELEIDANMATAVQEYLDAIRATPTFSSASSEHFVEYPFHAKAIHEQMYGRSDYVAVNYLDRHLHVWDYKNGVGIVVSAKYNAQTLYYAAGVLEQMDLWNKIDTITTYIAQPNGFHPDGAIRSFTYTVPEVMKWLAMELLPAMILAETSRETKVGEHCRFCPARSYACPAMLANTHEIERMIKLMDGKGGAAQLTPEEMGHTLDVCTIGKIADKAVRKVALARLNKDAPVPGWKMVNGRVNRVWKDGACRVAYHEYGSQAFDEGIEAIAAALIKATSRKEVGELLTVDNMRSPAQMNKLPEGEKFCSRWAHKPPPPRTLAPAVDTRREVSTKTKAALFSKKG